MEDLQAAEDELSAEMRIRVVSRTSGPDPSGAYLTDYQLQTLNADGKITAVRPATAPLYRLWVEMVRWRSIVSGERILKAVTNELSLHQIAPDRESYIAEQIVGRIRRDVLSTIGPTP